MQWLIRPSDDDTERGERVAWQINRHGLKQRRRRVPADDPEERLETHQFREPVKRARLVESRSRRRVRVQPIHHLRANSELHVRAVGRVVSTHKVLRPCRVGCRERGESPAFRDACEERAVVEDAAVIHREPFVHVALCELAGDAWRRALGELANERVADYPLPFPIALDHALCERGRFRRAHACGNENAL